ncbi:hypothetical protein LEN26_011599 [Aphanomyces euteiches]|nr:hypothetical protein AeMF1_015754 [Aphanomyces euteiches]KAH9119516.1 hypothetical protein LEN26_011599 [Aphanomyces euteiches]
MSLAICQGQCKPTTLGILLNIVRWLFILGCPLAVFCYQVLKIRPATKTNSNESPSTDVDGQNDIEQVFRREQLLDVLLNQVNKQRQMMGNVVWHITHPLASEETIAVRRQRRRRRNSYHYQPDASYVQASTPVVSHDQGGDLAFPPDESEPRNQLDEYIDLTKVNSGRARGAYTIKMNPQTYLETMHENVVPSLWLCIIVLLVAILVFEFHPLQLTSKAVLVNPSSCISESGHPCEHLNWTNITLRQYRIEFEQSQLPSGAELLALELQLVDHSKPLDKVYDMGLYHLSLSTPKASHPVVQNYTNKLAFTCNKSTCSTISLAAVSLQRYDAALFDLRQRSFVIELEFTPPSVSRFDDAFPAFQLHVTFYVNTKAWLGIAIRCFLGLISTLFLVHFVWSLHKFALQRYAETIDTKSVYFHVWGHMSLERHLMVLMLFVLAVNGCPLMLLLNLPFVGAARQSYIIFRTVWETLSYVIILTSLMVIMDSYRKDCRQFSNGASLRIIGLWSILAKVGLAACVVLLRLGLLLFFRRSKDEMTHHDQWMPIVDILLVVAGISIFLYVAGVVHHVLEAQPYTQTRYLSLSFRYVTMVAFAILALLLLESVTTSAYPQVSTTKPTEYKATPLILDVSVAVLVFFLVLAYYPPSKLEPGLIPRGYVIREKRQYAVTPPENNSGAPSAFNTENTSPPSERPAGGRLQRMGAFRAKSISRPHHLLCLETASLLLNCSRYAYYRSSLFLSEDTGDDGVVKNPAAAYVNQFALMRDGLEEVLQVIDEQTDTNCLILHADFRIIFAFRGTVSKANVKTDLDVALDPIPWLPDGKLSLKFHQVNVFEELDTTQAPFAHRGFLRAYGAVRERCHAALDSLLARYGKQGLASDLVHVYCTGHSLGGALATLAALDFKLNMKLPVVLYNYGSPRVGSHGFSRLFNANISLAFRLVNEGDIICGLPQRVSTNCFGQGKKLYKHIGTEVVMDGKINGDFIIRPTFAEKNLIVEVRKRPGRHYLTGYKENLQVILDVALRNEKPVGDYHLPTAFDEALYHDSMDDEEL